MLQLVSFTMQAALWNSRVANNAGFVACFNVQIYNYITIAEMAFLISVVPVSLT